MLHIKFPVISRTRALENKIDCFHDKMIEAAAVFHRSIKIFLNENSRDEYKSINKQIKTIEHEADKLRRDIENDLYSQNLLPNLQADILQLIEGLDKINNQFDDVIYKFYIEQPQIPAPFHRKLIELCYQVADCAENMAIASRRLFQRLKHRPRLFAQSLHHGTGVRFDLQRPQKGDFRFRHGTGQQTAA